MDKEEHTRRTEQVRKMHESIRAEVIAAHERATAIAFTDKTVNLREQRFFKDGILKGLDFALTATLLLLDEELEASHLEATR